MGLQTLALFANECPILSHFGCFSGHVLSKTKSVTPHFFYISDITNSSSYSGKSFRKKSMLKNFRANVLKFSFNEDKCKEMRIQFSKIKTQFCPLTINNKELEIVRNVKILGIIIGDDLNGTIIRTT